MRISAQIVFAFFLLIVFTSIFKTTANAQTSLAPTPTPLVATSDQSSSNNGFTQMNTDANVPQNRDAYTQVLFINTAAAFMCQLAGVDPINPQQPCLGVDPTTGKIGMITQQSANGTSQPQIGGAVGVMSGYISSLYIPPISSRQYTDYLSSNFGIVKHAEAANGASNVCPALSFGYGFCGLAPIFNLWTGIRDFAYALLTVLFIAIGIGVMLRFRVDPRTVMTLQNQIPRVVIAIILITFSYAIAGAMIDLMWTVTYAGINFISNTASTSTVCLKGSKGPQQLAQTVEQRLNQDPISFTNTVFSGPNLIKNNCDKFPLDSGLLSLSSAVSVSFGDLVTQTLADLLGIQNGCGVNWNLFHDLGCLTMSGFGKAIIWFTEQIIKLIIIVAILIALFRLWFQLIKCYVTFLIFVIMGPIWIVFGLIPGRPLGFEKWLRIIFANLAAFPLVAFILVFARVIVDAIPNTSLASATTTGATHIASAASASGSAVLAATTGVANPQVVFIPPLIGNPNLSTFAAFIGFGAIMIAPSIPDLIKDRMKATGQGKYGGTIAAGIGFAAGAVTSPGRKTWETLNRRNSMTGAAEGSLAIMRDRIIRHTPGLGGMQRRRLRRIHEESNYHYGGFKTEAERRAEAEAAEKAKKPGSS